MTLKLVKIKGSNHNLPPMWLHSHHPLKEKKKSRHRLFLFLSSMCPLPEHKQNFIDIVRIHYFVFLDISFHFSFPRHLKLCLELTTNYSLTLYVLCRERRGEHCYWYEHDTLFSLSVKWSVYLWLYRVTKSTCNVLSFTFIISCDALINCYSLTVLQMFSSEYLPLSAD